MRLIWSDKSWEEYLSWSRRVTDEHRLVYEVENDALYIVSCKYHY